jgi:hypothetical protein
VEPRVKLLHQGLVGLAPAKICFEKSSLFLERFSLREPAAPGTGGVLKTPRCYHEQALEQNQNKLPHPALTRFRLCVETFKNQGWWAL